VHTLTEVFFGKYSWRGGWTAEVSHTAVLKLLMVIFVGLAVPLRRRERRGKPGKAETGVGKNICSWGLG